MPEKNETKINLIKVPVNLIDFNPYNPNIYTTTMLDSLKENIQRYGFIEPGVASKRKDGRYMILDGEHRVRAMKELGIKDVPLIIVEGLDELPVEIAPLMFNEIRGKISEPKKRAIVLDALKNYSKEELQRYSDLDLRKAVYSFIGDESQLKRELDAAREIETVGDREVKEIGAQNLEDVSRTLIISGFTLEEHHRVLKKLSEIDKNPKKAMLALVGEEK